MKLFTYRFALGNISSLWIGGRLQDASVQAQQQNLVTKAHTIEMGSADATVRPPV